MSTPKLVGQGSSLLTGRARSWVGHWWGGAGLASGALCAPLRSGSQALALLLSGLGTCWTLGSSVYQYECGIRASDTMWHTVAESREEPLGSSSRKEGRWGPGPEDLLDAPPLALGQQA